MICDKIANTYDYKQEKMQGYQFGAACVAMFICAVLYCEILVDYFKLYQCKWPTIRVTATSAAGSNKLHALVLADTHLLGPLRGHWLDKLYREWHMHRAFQTAITLFQPELVFVLGDLFDEGDLVNDKQFDQYVQRFHRLFRTPEGMHVISAAGNHDLGFHYKMHPYYTERFAANFNNTSVQLYTFKENHFVFINSMAMENDGCEFCTQAQHELRQISIKLNCLKNPDCTGNAKLRDQHGMYSRPVLMQHFPTYRISDKVCRVHDSPTIQRYREKWEVLSKQSTDLLGKLLHPRLAFAGHSHHYCEYKNRLGIDEYTVASFSWRNKINPSFLLATITPKEHSISKCDMPTQSANYTIYFVTFCTCISLLVGHLHKSYSARILKQLTERQLSQSIKDEKSK